MTSTANKNPVEAETCKIPPPNGLETPLRRAKPGKIQGIGQSRWQYSAGNQNELLLSIQGAAYLQT